jgi:hypothetical protein
MEEGSFKEQKKIANELLQQRITTVKELKQDELEMYEIAKDSNTGDHYLHYSYLHRNISDTGAPEVYHQLLPLESDDVLGLIFGEQAYTYPDHWHKSFLRNGPDGFFIWFDPDSDEERMQNEEYGARLTDKLRKFKESGSLDPESVRKLLEDLDDDANSQK